ncbi:GTP cyclohydrolase I FolE2, partial [bacterium]|nr:GTP cyclohydrolase I FolE2 [bacterium]
AVFDGAIEGGNYRFKLGVTTPVTTLCPCSKEISDEGAHSQRARIYIETVSSSFIWIEELVEIAERAGSAPVFSLLKREDEKFVSEMAYENPRFVEDVARMIARELDSREDITEYTVHVVSEESIHNHAAFARISGGSASPTGNGFGLSIVPSK